MQIVTDEHFRMAAAQWLTTQTLTGVAFVSAGERKIFDEQPDSLVDITPTLSVLEAALDTALAEEAQQQEIDEARAALQTGKLYFQKQLVSVTPHNLTQLVNNIKPVVDGNTYLLRMVENKIDVMSVAYVWTAATVKVPVTALDRARYIEAVMQIIALLA